SGLTVEGSGGQLDGADAAVDLHPAGDGRGGRGGRVVGVGRGEAAVVSGGGRLGAFGNGGHGDVGRQGRADAEEDEGRGQRGGRQRAPSHACPSWPFTSLARTTMR